MRAGGAEVIVPLDALENPPAGLRHLHRSTVLPGAELELHPSAGPLP